MKQVFYIIVLIFSLNSFSQNILLGEWSLQTIIIDGVSDSDIPDGASINFTTEPGDGSGFYLDGIAACNGYGASYVMTGVNTFDITTFYPTLAVCDTSEEGEFENKYFNFILYSEGDITSFEYAITGTGIDTTLTITNLITNNVAIYAASSENDLLGEWFLYNIEVGGTGLYSTVPNLIQTILFNNDYSFNGGGCNTAYTGSTIRTSESSFYFNNFVTLATSCIYPMESNLFLEPYHQLLSNLGPEQTQNYTISMDGMNEILTITNTQGNRIVYGRAPLPVNNLPGMWYLQSISKNNVQELNVYEPNFNINFTLNSGMFAGLNYDGFAVCHDYFDTYRLEGIDGIRLNGISYTLDMCQQYGGMFEESYFSFFGEASSGTMLLNYDVSGSGDDETLILTDADGDFVTYGRQPINVPDTELVSRWYLQYVNVDGEQLDNFYNRPSYSLELDLTNIAANPSESILYYNGSSSCNEFGGSYTYTESSLTFELMAITLIGCDLTPQGMYESYYLNNILTSDNNLPSTLDFTLTDSGMNQTLTLTAASGDFAVYGKTAPTTQFFTTWYLSSIESNGIITEISSTEAPTINLTSSRYYPIFPGLTFNGQGDCNAFDGDYLMYVNNTNTIKINNFNPESATCSSDYETDYFQILSADDTNEFTFELLYSNATLRLTDLAGNRLVYGSQPLSLSENTVDKLSIRLKENPVQSELLLITNASLGNRLSYQIFSVDGKQIQERQILQNDVINVEKLNSGLYFLAVSSENNLKQTLKFIKE